MSLKLTHPDIFFVKRLIKFWCKKRKMKKKEGTKASGHSKPKETRIALSQSIIQALEGERKRIARDIHDHLGQQIIELKLKLHGLSEKCKTDQESIERINELQSIAEQMDSEVDFLDWELRSSVLENLGLTALSLTIDN
jgi:signal transduction histidine kinase